jgi:alpha-tubulin suppressor-like RCC1 family protein
MIRVSSRSRSAAMRRSSFLATLASVLVVSTAAHAGASPTPGVWYGNVGEHPVIACIEAGRAAYYYPGQPADISLGIADGTWTETSQGKPTGRWTVDEQSLELSQGNRIAGTWRDARGGHAQDFELLFLIADDAACAGATYRQALLPPDEPRLSLPLPPATGQVAASGEAAAVVQPDGDLWTWGRNLPPKRFGSGFLRVALGRTHWVALKADGSLWGWGSNYSGQLGGATVSGDPPAHMGDDYVSVAASDDYSVAVRKDGTLWSWGGAQHSGKGELLETLKSRPRLMGKDYVSVVAGDGAFAAFKVDGSMWMWGGGIPPIGSQGSWFYGQYGHEALPRFVTRDFASVSIGSVELAVRRDGTLVAWGGSRWGALGDGRMDAFTVKPIEIGSGFVQAVGGDLQSAAVKADGTLWLWGGNQLGLFGDCTRTSHPAPVQVGDGVVQAALGAEFLVAMKKDGSVWTWGWPWDGDQMETPRACRKPARVVFGDGVSRWDSPVGPAVRLQLPLPKGSGDIVSIAAGESHSAMVMADGSLWTWGSNEFGQLATGTTDSRRVPQRVGGDFVEVSTDFNHTLALKKDGSLWHWGVDLWRRLSANFAATKDKALAPTQAFPGTTRLLHSGPQFERGLGLAKDGAILDWGYFSMTSDKPTPFGTGVREIAAGPFGSNALRTDGSLWVMEQYPVRPPPRQIGRDFVQVVRDNDDHAFGLKSDGSLWSWGANGLGQLGDGTHEGRGDPVRIGGGFVQVATGRFHGIALASDGSVWTWGDNEDGAIGDGTTVARLAPVKVATGFVKVAAGDHHNLAVKADGTLWAWGNNEDGQLGDGTTTRRLVPVQVWPPVPAGPAAATKRPTAIREVRVGAEFACAVYRDGAMKCWGNNHDGQLGNDRHLDVNPLPIAVENPDAVRAALAVRPPRRFDCAVKAKDCARIEARQSFLRGAKSIVQGDDVQCGLMPDGKVRCGKAEGLSYPMYVVEGIDDAVQVDLGCALLADGRVKCWGGNRHGERGNGAASDWPPVSDYRSVATPVSGL